MANKLGRGLGSIIPQATTATPAANTIVDLPIDKIEVNPNQPRTVFNEDALAELADSIKQVGIIQPITVRESDDGHFQIISGERRYRASQMAGLKAIPAFIRKIGDEELLKLALLENIQREDLNAIDIAISYQRMIDELSLTQEEVSRQVSKKRATVTNYLRLLKLPAEAQRAIREGFITMGHARALINIDDHDFLVQLLNDIIKSDLSVRQVETLVRLHNNPEPEPKPVVETPSEATETPAATTASDDAASDDATTAKADDDTVKPTEKPTSESIASLPDEPEDVIFVDTKHGDVPPDSANEQLRDTMARYFSTKVDLKRDTNGAGRITIHFRTDDEFHYILQKAEKLNGD